MQRFLVAEGRGRKIALQQLPLTNKLLLRVNLLHQTCQKSWEEISSLFDTVTEQELLHTSLKSEVNRANRGAAAVHGGSGDIESFLSFNVGDELELRNVGPFLLKTGVKRHQLLSPASLQDIPTPAVPVVNGLILDLLFFPTRCRLCASQRVVWLCGCGHCWVVGQTVKRQIAKNTKTVWLWQNTAQEKTQGRSCRITYDKL